MPYVIVILPYLKRNFAGISILGIRSEISVFRWNLREFPGNFEILFAYELVNINFTTTKIKIKGLVDCPSEWPPSPPGRNFSSLLTRPGRKRATSPRASSGGHAALPVGADRNGDVELVHADGIHQSKLNKK